MACYTDFVALLPSDLDAPDLQKKRLRECPQVMSRNWYPEPLEELEVGLLGKDAPPVLEREAIPVGSTEEGCMLVPLLPELRDLLASDAPEDVERVAAFFDERDMAEHGREIVALARRAKGEGRALFVYVYGY